MTEETPVSNQTNDERLRATTSVTEWQDSTRAELVSHIESLEAEVERLREDIVPRARQRYRRGAVVLGVLGLVTLSGAVVLPGLRTVLLALAGSGVFLAILTYFLTPERFVAADTARGMYGTLADNETAIIDDLALEGAPHVVPGTGQATPARLFIPLKSTTSVPKSIESNESFRSDWGGLVLQPTGAPLYDSIIATSGPLPSSLDELSSFVAEALVEQFELADAVELDVEPGRTVLAVYGSVLGPLDHFDHPVASVFATSLAVEQGTPVAVEVARDDTGDGWIVTCRWDTDTRGRRARNHRGD